MEKANIPKIRFDKFNDDWEQRKFGELAEYKKGPFGSAITKSMFVPKSDDSVKVYEQQNAINKDWSLERYFLPKEYAYTKLKAFEVHGGDIIVSCAGTIGEIYEIPDNAEYGVINQALMRVRVDEKTVDKRMFIIAFSNMINEFTRTHSNGSAIKNIPPFADLKPMKVLMPSMEEQRVISEYFEKMDNLITLHQRKYEKLQMIKKSMLEKMFPQNGEKKPEIRFEGFTDDWEQRKLGDMMDVTSVKRIHQSDWTDSGVRFLRARDIVAESKNEEVSEPLFISQEKYDEYSAISGKVEKGDLLVTGVGTIGVPMLINSEKPLYFKDGNIIWFKNKNTIDGRFFYHSFNGLNIQKFIKESSGTGTVGTYTIETGKKTPINLPPQKEEQEKIGLYFSNLDYLITLHQRKLEKLRNIKKSMLEKMFV